MGVIKKVLHNPAAAVLEAVSIIVTVILLTSLAGNTLGWSIFCIISIAYEMLKVWQIIEVKKRIRDKQIWGAFWRSLYLAFLIVVALVAAFSYSLTTIAQQKIESTADSAILENQKALSREITLSEAELAGIEEEVIQIDTEITSKLGQIEELPPGWITASERLSKAIKQLQERKRVLNAKSLKVSVQLEYDRAELNRVETEMEQALGFGAVASEEFTRIADTIGVDPELFLKIFILSILAGVEFGLIMLLKPEPEQVTKEGAPPVDRKLEEMDTVIDAMLSRGTAKLPGVRTISEISGVSIPRVTAYRAAFIQNGFVRVMQGASSATMSGKEMKREARKVRDQIDI